MILNGFSIGNEWGICEVAYRITGIFGNKSLANRLNLPVGIILTLASNYFTTKQRLCGSLCKCQNKGCIAHTNTHKCITLHNY